MKLCTIRGVEIRGGILLLAAVIIGCVLGRLNEMLQAMAALTLHEMAHVIVAAVFEQRIYAIELQPFGCVARMSDKTLTPHAELCIAVADPVIPIQYLPIEAALAVRAGLDEETALASITRTAAKIVGLGDSIGTLEPGKDADIGVFSAHPFDFRARCEMTFVRGKLAWQEDRPA
jgi:hypothetical protein